MSIIHDSTHWMIWADKCLIEKVEKNPHKPPNYSVFMSRISTMSKTALSDQRADSLKVRESCKTTVNVPIKPTHHISLLATYE